MIPLPAARNYIDEIKKCDELDAIIHEQQRFPGLIVLSDSISSWQKEDNHARQNDKQNEIHISIVKWNVCSINISTRVTYFQEKGKIIVIYTEI